MLFNWLSNRSLESPEEEAAANLAAPAEQAPAAAAPQGQGPVVITASDTAWIEVKDGAVILRQGELATGQSFEVPANAVAPTLTTAKPEALRISVGTADAPAFGEAGRKTHGQPEARRPAPSPPGREHRHDAARRDAAASRAGPGTGAAPGSLFAASAAAARSGTAGQCGGAGAASAMTFIAGKARSGEPAILFTPAS